MINPMNARDPGIKQTTLHGRHDAGVVYCDSWAFKPGAGILHCEDIIYGVDWSTIDESKLNYNDRCFNGVLYFEDAFIGGERQGEDKETEEWLPGIQDC